MNSSIIIVAIATYGFAAYLPCIRAMQYRCEVSKALFNGNETEAIRLLELGFDASTPDQYDRLPMHFAAEQGFIKAIRLLINKGYKNQIHSRTAFGESPINRAVAAQEFEITDLLIKMGSNLNDQKLYVSYSPLMTAALIGNEKIVKLLVDNGADMFIKSTYGATARTLAESGGYWKIVHLLDAYAVRKLPKSTESCTFRVCRMCPE